MNAVVRMWPMGLGPRLRAAAYRLFGISVGSGTLIHGPLHFGWYGEVFRNLRIGRNCFFNRDTFFDTTAPISIGDGVVVGPELSIYTSNHDLSFPEYRAGAVKPHPVAIGNGVWIAARVTILPGVHIGHGVAIAAGSVVTQDVPDNVLVAGVPARVIRALDPNSGDLAEQTNLLVDADGC